MNFSLNEVKAQAAKAARGAGYSWGMADEAGMATAWLCAQGLNGVSVLAKLLRAAPPQDACPLMQGTRLSDMATLPDFDPKPLRRIVAPALVMPFVAGIARRQGVTLQITWLGGEAFSDGEGLWVEGDMPLTATDLMISTADHMPNPRQKQTRARPLMRDWTILGTFAHRTYAPATEESRRLGAGE